MRAGSVDSKGVAFTSHSLPAPSAQILRQYPTPELSARDRAAFHDTIIPLACERADDTWLKYMSHPDDASRLRSMPALGPGLLERLSTFNDSDQQEYKKFRVALASGSLPPPAPGASLLVWYSGITMPFLLFVALLHSSSWSSSPTPM